jgi:hypothetical protein
MEFVMQMAKWHELQCSVVACGAACPASCWPGLSQTAVLTVLVALQPLLAMGCIDVDVKSAVMRHSRADLRPPLRL